MSHPFDWRRTPGLGAYAMAMIVFLYVPLVVLVAFSFNAGNLVTVWRGFSLVWFAKVLANGDLQSAARNSLIVASSAAILSTLLATAAALGFERGAGARQAGVMSGLFALPLIVPEIVTAVTTLAFFSMAGLRLKLGNLVIAHTVFCTAFAMLPIRARLRGMGETLEHAARDLYAPPLAVFRRITLPLLAPAIVSGALIAFVVSLDDFVLSALVGDAGTTTLPVYVYGMIRRGITPEVNAASTLLLAASLLLAGVGQFYNRPRRAN